MPRIEEVYNTKEVLNYFKERQMNPMLGESLFPEKKIQDIEFDMILGKGGLPVSASVHAFDTKTQLASREAIQKGAAALSLIKRQIKVTEKELIKIQNPRSEAELNFTLSQLYDDAEKMVSAIKVRVEAMRMEVLSTGKLKIEENGVKVTLDYGVPSNNKKSFNWSDATNAAILDDLEKLVSAVEGESGSRPTRALTSRKIAKKICACESIRKAIHGVNSDKLVTLAQLNDLLAQCELPQIATYEDKYKVETSKGYVTKRYFPENIISVFGDGELGESIYGLTAEEVKLIGDGKMEESEMINNIFVGTYTSIDPVGEFTKAAATFLPSFPHADELGIGTITI